MGFSPDFWFAMSLAALFVAAVVAMQVFQGPPPKRPEDHPAE